MLEKANIDADELLAVRDRELSESYAPDEIAEAILTTRLRAQFGFRVHSIEDMAPGAEEVFHGVAPDALVKGGGKDVCTVEIKTKREEHAEWYGRLNKRQYNDYVAMAEEQDAPFLVYFATVDMSRGAITQEDVIEITGDEVADDVSNADGNDVVCLDEDQFRSLSWVLELAHDGEYAPRVREVDGC